MCVIVTKKIVKNKERFIYIIYIYDIILCKIIKNIIIIILYYNFFIVIFLLLVYKMCVIVTKKIVKNKERFRIIYIYI